MFWTFSQVFLQGLISLGSFLIITQHITASELGLFTFSLIWYSFFSDLIKLGVGEVILRGKKISEKDINICHTISICMSIIVMATALFILIISDKYGLTMFFLLSSLCISNLVLVKYAFLRKMLEFKKVAIITIFSQAIGAILGVLISVYHGGFYGLLFQIFITTCISSALFYYFGPSRPSLVGIFNLNLIGFDKFYLKIYIFKLLKFISQNIDSLIVKFTLGTASLGIYSLGYKLGVEPGRQIIGAVTLYSYPKISSSANNPAKIVDFLKIYFCLGFLFSLIYTSLIFTAVHIMEEMKIYSNLEESFFVIKTLSCIIFFSPLIMLTTDLQKIFSNGNSLILYSLISPIIVAILTLIGGLLNIYASVICVLISYLIIYIYSSILLIKIIPQSKSVLINSYRKLLFSIAISSFIFFAVLALNITISSLVFLYALSFFYFIMEYRFIKLSFKKFHNIF